MRKAALFLLSLATAVLVVVYLLASLTPYFNPARWWPGTFLSLLFPLFAIAMALTIIVWCFVRGRIALVLLVLFLFGYKNLAAVFGFHSPSAFRVQKDSSALRVLDWNVRAFTSNAIEEENPNGVRRRMLNYIKEVDPDVLLMQEFVELVNKGFYSNIKALRDTLGYSYYFISGDQTEVKGERKYGSAIFSKTPLLQQQRHAYTGDAEPESLITADILFGGRRVRLATTHLVSLNLGGPPNDTEYFGRKDSHFILHSSQLQRLKRYDSIHGQQADFIQQILKGSKYPVIISGDFNSVPSSYTYHTIKADRQDAFLQKGFGFGNTYVGLSPTLRIDYILLSRQFKVKQFTSPKLVLSDHYPLVTDIAWR
jgi:endonuclease/exonuclease/phosphatase family metal-dependent hydrolase